MPKLYDMHAQLQIGELGVTIAKAVLRTKYPHIDDLAQDRDMQKRGIDLWVEGLGYVEVKTDTHAPDSFFFELDVGGKPGAIDRSCADWIAVLFYKYNVMFLIKRASLSMWLRDNLARLKEEKPKAFKTTMSRAKDNEWSATGVLVPREEIVEAMQVTAVRWEDATLTESVWEHAQ